VATYRWKIDEYSVACLMIAVFLADKKNIMSQLQLREKFPVHEIFFSIVRFL